MVRRPSMFPWYAVPVYPADNEFLIFAESGIQLVGPRACRRCNLFVRGLRLSVLQRYCELDKCCGHAYADHSFCASWSHASQSHLSESYRGSFSLLRYFQCLTRASSKARRLGQAIHPIFVCSLHREIIRRHKSCCAGVFPHRRTYVQPFRSPSFVSSFVAEWHSGLSDANLTFFGGVTSFAGVIYHSVTVSSLEFMEVADQAVWGTLYYAMQTVSNRIPSAFLLSL